MQACGVPVILHVKPQAGSMLHLCPKPKFIQAASWQNATLLLVSMCRQVFQSISKEIMVRQSATQDQAAGSGGQGGSTIRVGQTPAGDKKKAACCA